MKLGVYLEIRVFNPFNAEATFVQCTRTQRFEKPSQPCHVGIHWIAPAEYSHMSTHLTGFRSFSSFFASFRIGHISHHQHKGLSAKRSFITVSQKESHSIKIL